MIRLSYSVLFLLMLTACQQQVPSKPKEETTRPKTSFSTEETREMLRQERQVMEGVFQELNLTPQRTGTGLMYCKVVNGAGAPARNEDEVQLRRDILLPDGTFIDRLEGVFLVGRDSKLELGIHEGLLLTSAGDSVVFVLPSHLAYGMTGDGQRIPPGSPLVVYLKLKTIQR